MVNMYMNVGKMYHDQDKDVQRLLIMADAYITYRLEKELGLKPKERLSLNRIASLQASINKRRRTLRVKYIRVLQEIRVINRRIRKRESQTIRCDGCGNIVLRKETLMRVDKHYFLRRLCDSCVEGFDEEKPIQVCPLCKEPYDESYSGCTCHICGFCGEGFHLKDLIEFDNELLCKGCLEIAKER